MSLSFDEALERFRVHAKDIPGDGLWIEMGQELARLIERLGDRIDANEAAVLVGLGAVIWRQGFSELQAGIRTDPRFRR